LLLKELAMPDLDLIKQAEQGLRWARAVFAGQDGQRHPHPNPPPLWRVAEAPNTALSASKRASSRRNPAGETAPFGSMKESGIGRPSPLAREHAFEIGLREIVADMAVGWRYSRPRRPG
jgi:hypothetical protein